MENKQLVQGQYSDKIKLANRAGIAKILSLGLSEKDAKKYPRLSKIIDAVGTAVGTTYSKEFIDREIKNYTDARTPAYETKIEVKPGELEKEMARIAADLEAKIFMAADVSSLQTGELASLFVTVIKELITTGIIDSGNTMTNVMLGAVYPNDNRVNVDVIASTLMAKVASQLRFPKVQSKKIKKSLFSADGAKEAFAELLDSDSPTVQRVDYRFQPFAVGSTFEGSLEDITFILSSSGTIIMPTMAELDKVAKVTPFLDADNKVSERFKLTFTVATTMFISDLRGAIDGISDRLLAALAVKAGVESAGFGATLGAALPSVLLIGIDMVASKIPAVLSIAWIKDIYDNLKTKA